jgi:hypothetical protein
MSPEEAHHQIGMMEQQMRQVGGLDAEPGMIKRIKDQLSQATISPEEAVRQVHLLAENRQEYR